MLKCSIFRMLVVPESKDKDINLCSMIKVSVLFMSTDMNKPIVELLQKMLGIQLFYYNACWGDATYFHKNNVGICSYFTTQCLRKTKVSILRVMKQDKRAKIIIFLMQKK